MPRRSVSHLTGSEAKRRTVAFSQLSAGPAEAGVAWRRVGDSCATMAGHERARDVQRPGPVGGERATSPDPLLDRDSTLRDALSAMLSSAVQEGLVVDGEGRLLGSLTIEAVGSVLRRRLSSGREQAAPPAELVPLTAAR